MFKSHEQIILKCQQKHTIKEKKEVITIKKIHTTSSESTFDKTSTMNTQKFKSSKLLIIETLVIKYE